MGTGAGSSGLLTIDNSTMVLSAPFGVSTEHQIGQAGSAELNILNGGVVDNQGVSNLSLGTLAGGSGILNIDGLGSAWKYT
ncbi:hypothetical protein SB767_35280, partial [Bacillus sp. SIMBA_069]